MQATFDGMNDVEIVGPLTIYQDVPSLPESLAVELITADKLTARKEHVAWVQIKRACRQLRKKRPVGWRGDKATFIEPEHKDELVATSDYMRGLIDGDEGRSPLDTPSGLRTSEYYRGHTAGTERRRARHEGNQHLYFETNGMRYGSDCRVVRGSFNKGA